MTIDASVRFRTHVVSAVFVVLLVMGMPARSQCSSCNTSSNQGPFEDYQAAFSPSTLGLPTGASAPAIAGVSYSDSPSIIVAAPGGCDPEYLLLLAQWSQIPGLQVIYARAHVTSSSADRERTALGEDVIFIGEPAASVACAQFQVGDRASPVTFLVNTEGIIIYRRRGFPNYGALRLTSLVEQFATCDTIPADMLQQHVLWYGDIVPEPTFSLYDPNGRAELLQHGKPTLLYDPPRVPRWLSYVDATVPRAAACC
jgi:hypothetical protein